MATSPKFRVLFPIHPGFDVMDCFGPMEILSIANDLVPNKILPTDKAFEIVVAAEEALTESYPGVKIAAQMSMQDAAASLASFDIIVIPGGSSTKILAEGHKEPMGIIKAFASLPGKPRERIIVSVCTGSLFLATAGVLQGQTVTTNTSFLERLRKMVAGSSTTVAENGERFVVNPKGGLDSTGLPNYRIMTSAGPGSGLELTLWLIEYLLGSEVRERVEHLTEYRGPFEASLVLE